MTDNLNRVLATLKKKYGEDVIKRASDLAPLRTMPLGIASWDEHLGGGFLWGRTSTLAGKKASGKTSVAMKAGGVMQRLGGLVVWLDVEKQFDKLRAPIFGLNPEDVLIISDTEWTSELLFNRLVGIQTVLNQADQKVLYVVDSLTATMKETLTDGEKSASDNFGGSAAINNQIVTVGNSKLRNNQILIFINHLRDNLGMGDPNLLPGGKAQEFITSAMIWTTDGAPIKDGSEQIGFDMGWTVKKSRSSAPKTRGSVPFYYATGFDDISSLVETAIALDLIKGSGWYELPDGITTPDGATKVQGKDKLSDLLRNYPEFLNNLKRAVYAVMPVPFWDGNEK